jgi:hypothetical protein
MTDFIVWTIQVAEEAINHRAEPPSDGPRTADRHYDWLCEGADQLCQHDDTLSFERTLTTAHNFDTMDDFFEGRFVRK